MAGLVGVLPNSHDDLITDVVYDFYGRRLATAGTDLNLVVWDQNDEGEWIETSKWRAHQGSVNRVRWAHPEFGQILATCSVDRMAIVWEENPRPKDMQQRWVMRARLVDSKATVNDIAFAPKTEGLKIATASADGFIRIYEALNVMNVGHWTLMEDFEGRAKSDADDRGCRCISWSNARDIPLTIAVGSDVGVQVWQYNDTYRKWQEVELSTPLTHGDEVQSIDFAPTLGRSYQLLATGSKDGVVHIFKLKPEGAGRMNVSIVAELTEHESSVFRVEWNVSGTQLATSGDDGNVRIWQSNFLGEWKQTKIIPASMQA